MCIRDSRRPGRRGHRLAAAAGYRPRRHDAGGRDALHRRRPDRPGGRGHGQRGVGAERDVAGCGRRARAHPDGRASGQPQSVSGDGITAIRSGAATVGGWKVEALSLIHISEPTRPY